MPEFDLASQIAPEILNPRNQSDLRRIDSLIDDSSVLVLDTIRSQVSDLIKANFPEQSFTISELKIKVEDFFKENNQDTFGNWVYYPWKRTLVKVLAKQDFIKVRTTRNLYKITREEQSELEKKKIGIVGLSVGLSVALAIALERGCGELRIADFDILELSNLNRLNSGITTLGLEKSVIAARQITEIDPYLKVVVYRNGINESNIDEFLKADGGLDLLIDECDSLDIKFLLRYRAKYHEIPVMMETSDRGMVDIERFDLEPNRAIFHGMVPDVELSSLRELTSKEKVSYVLKITGLETLSPRMKASLLEIGQSITSWPQLASGVFLGGASMGHLSRKLLLGGEVSSGRFYVDFDELISDNVYESKLEDKALEPVQTVFPWEGIQISIPDNIIQSAYKLNEEELKNLLGKANLAPSGGNIQPWFWIFDKKGILHLFHDEKRSESMLDYKGIGSLIAFGGALENLRLEASLHGFEIEIIDQIQNFGQNHIASIRFISKRKQPIQVPHFELARGISLRCTNRKNTDRYILPKQHLNQLIKYAEEEGLGFEVIDQPDKMQRLAKVVGGMDRLRFFHDQGLVDFINEVRWNKEEAEKTKDGIDISTLELGGTELAAMGLLKDPRTVKFFRKFFMGYGLTKISKDSILSASAIGLLRIPNFEVSGYLKAGKVIQRIWIKANLMGYSFQPITAMLFIFQMIDKEEESGFSEKELAEVKELRDELNNLYNISDDWEDVFMFRINRAGEPSVRSFRRPVEDSLLILQ
ncbi:Rv1355c family protein [Algoriphagus namhaensis]|uniref:Rv1355c family protein n=1 Tax=Algoriphagus namhaensis TaxID=915353 RepID=A0ABV8AYA9_9BACT